jgi:hypothetical protein
LINICTLNRRFYNVVCDDAFIRRRLRKYDVIEKNKKQDESLKQFFNRAVYCIGKMKDKYEFEYIDGDFERHYYLLKYFNTHELLIQAVIENSLSLVKYAVKKGADISAWSNYCLRSASGSGHLEMVKYLLSMGANVNSASHGALQAAAFDGHLEVVKLLILSGSAIPLEALMYCLKGGHLHILKHIIPRVQFAITPSLKSDLLRCAKDNQEIIDYLYRLILIE